jgi:hypothetical protein
MHEAAQHQRFTHELLADLELIGAFALVRVDRHGVPFDFVFTGTEWRRVTTRVFLSPSVAQGLTATGRRPGSG